MKRASQLREVLQKLVDAIIASGGHYNKAVDGALNEAKRVLKGGR